MSDDCKVLFPNHEPASIFRAYYYVTPLGRVYRDDGRLLRPHAKTLKVKLNHGQVYMSVPAAIYAAFGNIDKGSQFVPWVPPDALIDELTGRRSCDVRTLRLVHHGNLVRLGHGTLKLADLRTYPAFKWSKKEPHAQLAAP